jgi:hypothetical protein
MARLRAAFDDRDVHRARVQHIDIIDARDGGPAAHLLPDPIGGNQVHLLRDDGLAERHRVG